MNHQRAAIKLPGITRERFGDFYRALVSPVKAMKDIRLVKRGRIARKQSGVIAPRVQADKYEVIGVGTSTGGPHALHGVLSRFPDNYPAPIVVVQHITPDFLDGLVGWMDSNITSDVTQAENDELLESLSDVAPGSSVGVLLTGMGVGGAGGVGCECC